MLHDAIRQPIPPREWQLSRQLQALERLPRNIRDESQAEHLEVRDAGAIVFRPVNMISLFRSSSGVALMTLGFPLLFAPTNFSLVSTTDLPAFTLRRFGQRGRSKSWGLVGV
jgi:hypothetical protein